MDWKKLLYSTFEYDYAITERLVDMVGDSEMNWKPATGSNWMTVGQLLHHISNSCGSGVKGFVTGDWGFSPDFDPSKMTDDMMPPTAEKLPMVSSVAEAKKLLAEDKKLAFDMLASCSEERLATEIAKAPWDKMELILGHRLLQMAQHLNSHKAQLFYYLKLQGKPVNTGHLWGV
jgi:hypothetical protein